jgi:hypothetical protein
MKKSTFTVIAILIITLISCSSNIKKDNTPVFRKSFTGIVTAYPHIEFNTNYTYDNENKIIKVEDENTETTLKISYKDNAISKVDYYFENSITYYKKVKNFNDSIYITKYTPTANGDIINYREVYYYNSSNQITKVMRYKKDSLDNWYQSGSMYEYEWKDGNLAKTKCYMPIESFESDTFNLEQNERPSLLVDKKEPETFTHREYSLFFETTYKFDNKNNPYKGISVEKFILPNENIISKNNPVEVLKKYSCGDYLKFIRKYEYNEQGYPVKVTVNVSSDMESIENTQYSKVFKY